MLSKSSTANRLHSILLVALSNLPILITHLLIRVKGHMLLFYADSTGGEPVNLPLLLFVDVLIFIFQLIYVQAKHVFLLQSSTPSTPLSAATTGNHQQDNVVIEMNELHHNR